MHMGPGRLVNDQVFCEVDKDLLKEARLLSTRGCGRHGHKENQEKTETNLNNRHFSHVDSRPQGWTGKKEKTSQILLLLFC